jgi:prepilin-type N-terminal cleavage/methylation domain-containing protein
MISTPQQTKRAGFTIIEVMIVLAIAGLIMLIVFLAVPSVQRSARNTQRKADTSAVAGAIANYISNNGGTVPATVGVSGTDIQICGASCAAGNTETSKLGYYAPANVSMVVNSAAPATPAKDTIVVDVGYACNATNTGLGAVSSRSAAILYATESGTASIAQQCVEQ